MKKKILSWVLAFFGLLGFALVLGGAIGAFAGCNAGVDVAITGLVVMLLAAVGDYFCNRLSYRPPPLPLDKQWNKIKKAL